MDADHLRAFLALANTLNVEQAARCLFLTTNDTIVLLDEVEAETQACLFLRSSTGELELTREGALFRRGAQIVLAVIDDLIGSFAASWRDLNFESKQDLSV
jgi:DNA-binding transcriptional LysR family regulator